MVGLMLEALGAITPPCEWCGQPMVRQWETKQYYSNSERAYRYCSPKCLHAASLHFEIKYIDEFKAFPPDEVEVMKRSGESVVWWELGTLFCAECGSTAGRDYLDPTQEKPRDFHWRPLCTQPYAAGWEEVC